VQQLRRSMLDADVNSLMFHNMDQLFTTRVVGRSGPVWQLPRTDHVLDFTYSFEGATYTPEQFVQRSDKMALALRLAHRRLLWASQRTSPTDIRSTACRRPLLRCCAASSRPDNEIAWCKWGRTVAIRASSAEE
jgi:hypothetical protein